jgi:hypothetical protein
VSGLQRAQILIVGAWKLGAPEPKTLGHKRLIVLCEVLKALLQRTSRRLRLVEGRLLPIELKNLRVERLQLRKPAGRDSLRVAALPALWSRAPERCVNSPELIMSLLCYQKQRIMARFQGRHPFSKPLIVIPQRTQIFEDSLIIYGILLESGIAPLKLNKLWLKFKNLKR